MVQNESHAARPGHANDSEASKYHAKSNLYPRVLGNLRTHIQRTSNGKIRTECKYGVCKLVITRVQKNPYASITPESKTPRPG